MKMRLPVGRKNKACKLSPAERAGKGTPNGARETVETSPSRTAVRKKGLAGKQVNKRKREAYNWALTRLGPS